MKTIHPPETLHLRTVALVVAAGLGACAAMVAGWPPVIGSALGFWFCACLVGEMMWVRLPLGRATLNMASCFNFAALLSIDAGTAMVAAGLATLLADLAIMRKNALRAFYNAAHTVLAVGAAASCFTWLAGGGHDLVGLLVRFNAVPFLAAALVYYLVNRTAVSLVVASHECLSPFEAWRLNFGNWYEIISTGAVLSLGALVAIHAKGVGLGATLLVVLPLLIAFDGYRRHLVRQERARDEREGSGRHAA
jgi:hypothetical protein